MTKVIAFELPPDLEAARARFETKVEKSPGGCWLWQGALDHRGYGRFRWNTPRSVLRAHRAAYALYKAVPGADDVVCHDCDNPQCVNPGHLFIGSNLDNTTDMHSKGRWKKPRPPLGARNGNTNLTDEKVLAIRSDTRGATIIAAEHGIHRKTVWSIKTRRLWTHI